MNINEVGSSTVHTPDRPIQLANSCRDGNSGNSVYYHGDGI